MVKKRRVVDYPVIANGAVEWLKEHLTSDTQMFEWGSGGSTIFFAERVSKIISIEHNDAWYGRVQETLEAAELTDRCELHYLPPLVLPQSQQLTGREASSRATVPGSYVSRHFPEYTFRDYVGHIKTYPGSYFDLVLVDGRARASCILDAIPKIRPRGHLVLDDAARKAYLPAMDLLKDWDVLTFQGPAPNRDPNRDMRTTLVWMKPDEERVE